jgi:pimeloyl-ACP methyl ester carboxylesterase
MDVPETRYAKTTDGVKHRVSGRRERTAGPRPRLLPLARRAHLDVAGRGVVPAAPRHVLVRLILFDRRGTGISDQLIAKDQQLSIDAQMDDIRAVMDATGSERAVLLSIDQFSTASVFAATFPERTVALVGYGAAARTAWAPDYPWGYPRVLGGGGRAGWRGLGIVRRHPNRR